MVFCGVKVYRVYRDDDADGGILRRFIYTLDPVNGGDDDTDRRVTFDVRDLSAWSSPAHPPYLSLEHNTPARRLAWRRHEEDRIEEKAIKATIRAALDKGEVATG